MNTGRQDMKLYEALRKAVRLFGIAVLGEDLLMPLLSDFRGFDEFPAMRQVMGSAIADGYLKELCRLAMNERDAECIHSAAELRKSLQKRGFRQELAYYAAESVLFALGLRTSVKEPSDHGSEASDLENVPDAVDTALRETEGQRLSEIGKLAVLLENCATACKEEERKLAEILKLTVLLKNCAAAWEAEEQKQSEIKRLLELLKKCATVKEENAQRQRELSRLAGLLRNCAAAKEEEEQRQFAIGRLTWLLRRIAVLDSVAESDGGHGMKLHESLRKIIRQFGINVLQEKRLMSLLADYRSFDDYPAMKDVMRAVADEGHGRELCRLAMDGSDSDFRRYADDVRKSLVRNGHFKETLAGYAVDSISFALGFQASVKEPSDHSFNALDSNNAAAPEETSVSEPSDAESLWNLGEKYYQGLECKNDYFKAAGYYRRALALLMKKETGREAGTVPARAQAPSPSGLSEADRLYALGEKSFYKRDYSKAVRFYQESAEHGSADAQYSIGVMYQHGLGVSRDYSEAEKWFRKAEAQGNTAARNALKAMSR